MLSVLYKGYIFEVQIAHKLLIQCRKGLDAHASYSRFRDFFEMLSLLKLLEDGWDVEPESAAMGDLQALRDEIKALQAVLAIKDAVIAAASGKIALLETENRALRGDRGGFLGFGAEDSGG